MAVHTPLSTHQIEDLLKNYQLGQFRSVKPIHGGVTNSNFFLETDQGEYVLTLFEALSAGELQFYIDVLVHLESYLPVACPIKDRVGERIQRIYNKPVVIAEKLAGEHIDQPCDAECRKIGETLAVLHKTTQHLSVYHPNPRSFSWQQKTLEELLPHLSLAEKRVAEKAFQAALTVPHELLPATIIHGDLFRDNVLFENETLTGILDFYYCCTDAMIYDIAVTAVDWCFDENNQWVESRFQGMLVGYEYIRKLHPVERDSFHSLLAQACSRFWLARRWAELYVTDETVLKKPSAEMYARLNFALSRIRD
ncbi:MAG TPA: homoserine kinase [Pseudomonadales bacterium]|nr:homoserine kinase [Pseudomonadales bacterium]